MIEDAEIESAGSGYAELSLFRLLALFRGASRSVPRLTAVPDQREREEPAVAAEAARRVVVICKIAASGRQLNTLAFLSP